MMLCEVWLLPILIIVFGFWWVSKSNKNKAFYKNIPSPNGLPLLGNSLDFYSCRDILPTLQKYRKNCGDTFKVQIGPFRKFIVTADYKFLETILSSTKLINKSADYKYLQSWLGSGLQTSGDLKWKKHRSILTPAFHLQILKQFVDVFEACGDKLIRKLEGKIGKKSFDVCPFVTSCALDIVCESIMGFYIGAQDDGTSNYVNSIHEMERIVMDRTLSPIHLSDFLYSFTRNYYQERQALKILHGQTNKVILARKQELAVQKSPEKTEEDEFFTKKKPFLDLLLEATVDGRPLTNEEIRNEVDTFMFAGHGTTSSAISFTLFCLANHPQVQEKALEEQRHIFGDQTNPTVSYADLTNMKYLKHVIKESLRLYPPVPLIGRRTTKEIEFDNNIFPEGDTIVIFAYGIHRNPKYFENPDNFIPERFDTMDGKFPYAYIPFSAGPRNCLGQKFAMLEMKSTISKILRKFQLEPASPRHELVLSSEAVLKSANGIKISLVLRK